MKEEKPWSEMTEEEWEKENECIKRGKSSVLKEDVMFR